jgi:integrase
MGVRQRENGRWQADVIVAGRRVRKDFVDRERAEAWEGATRAAMETKRPPKVRDEPPVSGASDYTDSPQGGRKGSEMRTLRDAMERAFDRYYRGTKWELKTWQTMKRVMGDIGADTPLSRINSDTLDVYVSKLRGQNKSGSTINSRLAVLSKVLRFSHDRGALDRLPRIERESVHNLRLRWLSPDEEAKVLETLRRYGKEDVAETVEALIDTGMRQSELFALSPSDVDLEAGTITIWQTRHGASKVVYKRTKNGEMRTIYMTQRVRKILERRVQSTTPDGLLFPGDIYWLRNAWDRVRAAMGMTGDPNFVPYICRHTCASRLVQKGIQIPVIQKWMGHKTIQITMRYANVAPENLRAAADTLEGGGK